MEKSKVVMLIVCCLSFCFKPALSKQEIATITPNQSIQYDDTLVSASRTFEAGFFSFGSPQRQYFGIRYKSISPGTVVWVANRDTPVQNSTIVLKLTHQGALVIIDGLKGQIWSSNSSTIGRNPVVQLLDSGNLVIKDGVNSVNFLWQSFDYPGDTFLAGMKLESNLKKGPYRSLTSWRDTEDPAQGDFSFHIDVHGLPQLVVAKGEIFIYISSGASWLRMQSFLNVSFVVTDKEAYYGFESSVASRAVLLPSGVSQVLVWSDQKQHWVIISTRPMDQCAYFGFCGANSNCRIDQNPLCECLEGFIPKFQAKWDSLDWAGGCVRRINLNCDGGDGFLKYAGMKLPDTSSSWFDKSSSLEECKTLCLKNCSCSAYANLDMRYDGSGCVLWFGNIVDLRVETDQGQDVYIRLASSELGNYISLSISFAFQSGITKTYKLQYLGKFNKKKLAGIVVGITTFIIGLAILGLARKAFVQRKKKTGIIDKIIHWRGKRGKEDMDLPTIFEFSTISHATNHFSNVNKLGEGGFGPVYKGVLVDGQEIAVKRLSETSAQGTEEFKNEMMLMETLQHRNLVKLLGCSVQQDEKLLIYEFMPNRSLDYFIFDSTRSKLLDWTNRFRIIDGIARGLLYLHQDSRLRIIHRDVKASNILLDNDMNPKISDFGLAKIFGGDQAEANTKRVMGTYGYMSPEYAVRGSFSIKSDIFSFGVIVLEIISGRKNRDFCDPNHHHNLLGHAWRLWVEERALELVDDMLVDVATSSEILRCIHVGLLCVQHRPENRPSMSSVVFMLNGGKLFPEPSQPGFYTERDSTKPSEELSLNHVSVSILEAR
ncbi:G-type lectin S-receptor-like serine/threonine-protein kinase SD1-1, partial [Mucuna pruriens]